MASLLRPPPPPPPSLAPPTSGPSAAAPTPASTRPSSAAPPAPAVPPSTLARLLARAEEIKPLPGLSALTIASLGASRGRARPSRTASSPISTDQQFAKLMGHTVAAQRLAAGERGHVPTTADLVERREAVAIAAKVAVRNARALLEESLAVGIHPSIDPADGFAPAVGLASGDGGGDDDAVAATADSSHRPRARASSAFSQQSGGAGGGAAAPRSRGLSAAGVASAGSSAGARAPAGAEEPSPEITTVVKKHPVLRGTGETPLFARFRQTIEKGTHSRVSDPVLLLAPTAGSSAAATAGASARSVGAPLDATPGPATGPVGLGGATSGAPGAAGAVSARVRAESGPGVAPSAAGGPGSVGGGRGGKAVSVAQVAVLRHGVDMTSKARRGVGRVLQAIAMYDAKCFLLEEPLAPKPGTIRLLFDFYARLFSPAKQLVGEGKGALTYAGLEYANATLSFGELSFLLKDTEVVPHLVTKTELQWIFDRRGRGRVGAPAGGAAPGAPGPARNDPAPETVRTQDMDYWGFLRMLVRIALFAFSKPQVAVSALGLPSVGTAAHAPLSPQDEEDLELLHGCADASGPGRRTGSGAGAPEAGGDGLNLSLASSFEASSLMTTTSWGVDGTAGVGGGGFGVDVPQDPAQAAAEAQRRRRQALEAEDALAELGLTAGLARTRLRATPRQKVRRLIRYMRLGDYDFIRKLLATVSKETDDMLNNPGPPSTGEDRSSYLPQNSERVARAKLAVAAVHARRTRLGHARGAMLFDGVQCLVDTAYRGGAASSTKGALRRPGSASHRPGSASTGGRLGSPTAGTRGVDAVDPYAWGVAEGASAIVAGGDDVGDLEDVATPRTVTHEFETRARGTAHPAIPAQLLFSGAEGEPPGVHTESSTMSPSHGGAGGHRGGHESLLRGLHGSSATASSTHLSSTLSGATVRLATKGRPVSAAAARFGRSHALADSMRPLPLPAHIESLGADHTGHDSSSDEDLAQPSLRGRRSMRTSTRSLTMARSGAPSASAGDDLSAPSVVSTVSDHTVAGPLPYHVGTALRGRVAPPASPSRPPPLAGSAEAGQTEAALASSMKLTTTLAAQRRPPPTLPASASAGAASDYLVSLHSAVQREAITSAGNAPWLEKGTALVEGPAAGVGRAEIATRGFYRAGDAELSDATLQGRATGGGSSSVALARTLLQTTERMWAVADTVHGKQPSFSTAAASSSSSSSSSFSLSRASSAHALATTGFLDASASTASLGSSVLRSATSGRPSLRPQSAAISTLRRRLEVEAASAGLDRDGMLATSTRGAAPTPSGLSSIAELRRSPSVRVLASSTRSAAAAVSASSPTNTMASTLFGLARSPTSPTAAAAAAAAASTAAPQRPFWDGPASHDPTSPKALDDTRDSAPMEEITTTLRRPGFATGTGATRTLVSSTQRASAPRLGIGVATAGPATPIGVILHAAATLPPRGETASAGGPPDLFGGAGGHASHSGVGGRVGVHGTAAPLHPDLDPYSYLNSGSGLTRSGRQGAQSAFHKGSTIMTAGAAAAVTTNLGPQARAGMRILSEDHVVHALELAGLWDAHRARLIAVAPRPGEGEGATAQGSSPSLAGAFSGTFSGTSLPRSDSAPANALVGASHRKSEWRRDALDPDSVRRREEAAAREAQLAATALWRTGRDASATTTAAAGGVGGSLAWLPLPPEHACVKEWSADLMDEFAPLAEFSGFRHWVPYAPASGALFMDFGRVLVGGSYLFRLALRNASNDTVRLRVTKQNLPGLSIRYRARPLAAGMTTTVDCLLHPNIPTECVGHITIWAVGVLGVKERVSCPCYMRAVLPGTPAAALANLPPSTAAAPQALGPMLEALMRAEEGIVGAIRDDDGEEADHHLLGLGGDGNGEAAFAAAGADAGRPSSAGLRSSRPRSARSGRALSSASSAASAASMRSDRSVGGGADGTPGDWWREVADEASYFGGSARAETVGPSRGSSGSGLGPSGTARSAAGTVARGSGGAGEGGGMKARRLRRVDVGAVGVVGRFGRGPRGMSVATEGFTEASMEEEGEAGDGDGDGEGRGVGERGGLDEAGREVGGADGSSPSVPRLPLVAAGLSVAEDGVRVEAPGARSPGFVRQPSFLPNPEGPSGAPFVVPAFEDLLGVDGVLEAEEEGFEGGEDGGRGPAPTTLLRAALMTGGGRAAAAQFTDHEDSSRGTVHAAAAAAAAAAATLHAPYPVSARHRRPSIASSEAATGEAAMSPPAGPSARRRGSVSRSSDGGARHAGGGRAQPLEDLADIAPLSPSYFQEGRLSFFTEAVDRERPRDGLPPAGLRVARVAAREAEDWDATRAGEVEHRSRRRRSVDMGAGTLPVLG